jgi:hypothetical protein
MNCGPWTVVCRDFAGHERIPRVVVRGSEVAIVAPPGETAVVDPPRAAQFRSTVVNATEVVTHTPWPGHRAALRKPAWRAQRSSTTTVYPQPSMGALLCWHVAAGTTTPIPGPAAIPATRR